MHLPSFRFPLFSKRLFRLPILPFPKTFIDYHPPKFLMTSFQSLTHWTPLFVATKIRVSRQLVYGHFVYDTSSTDISSTDISSTDIPSPLTFPAEIEPGLLKATLFKKSLTYFKEFFLTRSGLSKN